MLSANPMASVSGHKVKAKSPEYYSLKGYTLILRDIQEMQVILTIGA